MRKKVKSRPEVRVLIVGTSLIFRLGLRSLLQKDRGFQVVGDGDCAQAEKLARRLKPDILALDLDMPGQSALDMLRKLVGLGLPTHVVVLSVAVENPLVIEALRIGAKGVLMKDGTIDQKFQAFRTVQCGQLWVNPKILSAVLDHHRPVAPADASGRQDTFGLTLRERDILPALVGGRPNKDIAKEFEISEQTLKHHVSHIYDKLGVSTRMELALFAIHHSLTSFS